MAIYKINASLPTGNKIDVLSSQIIELEGLIEQAKFNLTEIAHLYSGSGLSRKFKRNVSLGHDLTGDEAYTGWTHTKSEDGYSIWKYSPPNYTYNADNQLYFDNKILTNKGNASTEAAQTFNIVYLYDGATYITNTTEAGTEGGTAFNLMDATGEYLYVGYSTTFKGIKFEFGTRGSNYDIVPEVCYSGATANSWVGLTSEVDSLVDNTSDFGSDGAITWDLDSTTGAGWVQNSVNSNLKYWVRLRTDTTPVTTATINYLIPSTSVISLLALSSSEILNETWAWCTYSTDIYVTIRNTGNSAYEGDYYLTSASSDTNKQNYFVYNHEFSADYQDTLFDASLTAYYYGDPATNDSWKSVRSGSSLTFQKREGGSYVTKLLVDSSGSSIPIYTQLAAKVDNDGTVNPTNLLSNGDFENWTAGTAVAPDGWTLTGTSATVAQGSTTPDPKIGTYYAEVTRVSGNPFLSQTSLHATKGINYWIGRTFTFGAWVYATVADRGRLTLQCAGSTNFYSSYHTGNSTWQWLTVTATIPAGTTSIDAAITIETGNTSVYFDAAMLVEGESAFAFSDKPVVYSDSRYKVGALSRAADAATGSVSTTSIGFSPKAIQLFAVLEDICSSQGFSDVTTNGSTIQYIGATTKFSVNTNAISIYQDAGVTKGQTAVVSSFGSDGFTLDWTRVGTSDAGTINVKYLAYR